MVLVSKHIDKLQECTNRLNDLGTGKQPENKQRQNSNDDFQKRRKIIKDEHIKLDEEEVKIVNSFKYLANLTSNNCQDLHHSRQSSDSTESDKQNRQCSSSLPRISYENLQHHDSPHTGIWHDFTGIASRKEICKLGNL